MGSGYIKVPRELFDSAEWRKKRVFGRVEAQLDLLQSASFVDGRVIHCAMSDVVLKRGQLLTTMRTLAERWGWSPSSVHRYLTSLREPSRGEIRIEIDTQIETGKTLITIVEYDRWELAECETPFETAPETTSGTPIGTQPKRKVGHATDWKIGDSESKRNNGFDECETPFETAPETQTETPIGTIIEIKNNNTGLKKDNNTHTLSDYKGGVGEKLSEAMALVQWVADTHPTLTRIRKPLTVEFATEILDRYDREDAEHIINSMADDMVTLTKGNFEQRFKIFAGCDFIAKPKTEKTKEQTKHYTYAEYCDEITSGRAKSEDFETVRENGKTYWTKKTAL